MILILLILILMKITFSEDGLIIFAATLKITTHLSWTTFLRINKRVSRDWRIFISGYDKEAILRFRSSNQQMMYLLNLRNDICKFESLIIFFLIFINFFFFFLNELNVGMVGTITIVSICISSAIYIYWKIWQLWQNKPFLSSRKTLIFPTTSLLFDWSPQWVHPH